MFGFWEEYLVVSILDEVVKVIVYCKLEKVLLFLGNYLDEVKIVKLNIDWK